MKTQKHLVTERIAILKGNIQAIKDLCEESEILEVGFAEDMVNLLNEEIDFLRKLIRNMEVH